MRGCICLCVSLSLSLCVCVHVIVFGSLMTVCWNQFSSTNVGPRYRIQVVRFGAPSVFTSCQQLFLPFSVKPSTESSFRIFKCLKENSKNVYCDV